jgi:uncharacterized protein (DUF305 family)
MRSSNVLAALLAAGLIVAGCGDDKATDSASSTPAVTGNGVDRAFVAAMVPHHRSAVQMAQIARRRGRSTFVRRLADDIVRTQSREIGLMRREDRRLAAAGVEQGSLGVAEHMMGMDANRASLRSAEAFDPAFVRMMIPHHEGAIVMADAERSKGGDPELTTLAQNIVTAQRREIGAMRRHLDGDRHMTDGGHMPGHGR